MVKTKAEEIAERQRQVSISEFFVRNRHLLGFDNPVRALLMTVKELVDNSIDAGDEMRVLPDVLVEIKEIGENRCLVVVEDNGPGIVKVQIPNVFGKLLYGSKFAKLSQTRGKQGLGVSVSVLYSQLTTGKPTKVVSRISAKKPAHYYELKINTQKNEPEILSEKDVDWKSEHGTKVEIELEARYQKGKQSVDEYIKQTAMVNPHVTITYINPIKEKIVYTRVVEELPREPKEIKPHPHGIELGSLMQMLTSTSANTLKGFLQNDFSRVGSTTAKEICNLANLNEKLSPRKLDPASVERIFKAMQKVRIIAPATDCLSPIGEELLIRGLKNEINGEFYAATSRSPSVYRGFPYIIEAGIAYGGELLKEEAIRLMRFANRVPLLYQQGACAITEAVVDTNWKPYGLQHSGGSMPVGPVIVVVHIASVWVPFTNEAKDAVAHYLEIIKEIKLALQEVGRQLGSYIRKTVRVREQQERVNLFEKYIPEVANGLSILSGNKKEKIEEHLKKILKRTLKNILQKGSNVEKIESKNVEGGMKKIGKEKQVTLI